MGGPIKLCKNAVTYTLLEDNDLVLDHMHDLGVTCQPICLNSLNHLCHPSFLVGGEEDLSEGAFAHLLYQLIVIRDLPLCVL